MILKLGFYVIVIGYDDFFILDGMMFLRYMVKMCCLKI